MFQEQIRMMRFNLGDVESRVNRLRITGKIEGIGIGARMGNNSVRTKILLCKLSHRMSSLDILHQDESLFSNLISQQGFSFSQMFFYTISKQW